MIDSVQGVNGIVVYGGWHTTIVNSPATDSALHNSNNSNIRFNETTGKLEYHTEHAWIPISNGPVTVELSSEVRDILDWCKNKMKHEQMIQELSNKYPSVRNSVEQLDTLVALLQDTKNG